MKKLILIVALFGSACTPLAQQRALCHGLCAIQGVVAACVGQFQPFAILAGVATATNCVGQCEKEFNRINRDVDIACVIDLSTQSSTTCPNYNRCVK